MWLNTTIYGRVCVPSLSCDGRTGLARLREFLPHLLRWHLRIEVITEAGYRILIPIGSILHRDHGSRELKNHPLCAVLACVTLM